MAPGKGGAHHRARRGSAFFAANRGPFSRAEPPQEERQGGGGERTGLLGRFAPFPHARFCAKAGLFHPRPREGKPLQSVQKGSRCLSSAGCVAARVGSAILPARRSSVPRCRSSSPPQSAGRQPRLLAAQPTRLQALLRSAAEVTATRKPRLRGTRPSGSSFPSRKARAANC